MSPPAPPTLSFCVVSTGRRQLLRYCLDAVGRERAAVALPSEVLVLDNASRDGSAEAARAHPATTAVIALAEPTAPGDAASALLQRAGGQLCLLLDAASELEPGSTATLHAALAADPSAGAAAARVVDSTGASQPSAWRFPGAVATALNAVGLGGHLVVQSRGDRVRTVDWARWPGLLVRREAVERIGDEVGVGRRLRAEGRRLLYVPEARVVAH